MTGQRVGGAAKGGCWRGEREREKKREREVWPGLRDEEESSGLMDYMGSYGLCLGLMN